MSTMISRRKNSFDFIKKQENDLIGDGRMQEHELVLSDVHLQVISNKGKDHCISRFYYIDKVSKVGKRKRFENKDTSEEIWEEDKSSLPGSDSSFEGTELTSKDSRQTVNVKVSANLTDTDVTDAISRDADGDVDVRRRKRKLDSYSVITVAHKQKTSLENVGQQIWLASLFMADFIVSHRDEFEGKTILDLGSGVGLTSIAASFYAKHVICSDVGKDILDLAQHNLDLNDTKERANFTVKELDWFHNKFSQDIENEDYTDKSWEDLESCDVMISADVIYDDDKTDALFRTVYGLLTNTQINTWYISLEKRFVFTITDLDVACPAYKHFRDCLNQLQDLSEEIQFHVSLEDDVPQCFQYSRIQQLELWKVTATGKRDNFTD